MQIPAWCYQCKTFISLSIESPLRGICTNCYNQLPYRAPTLCHKCGGAHLALHCKEHWASSLHRFHSIFDYKAPISDWITSLKYSQNLVAGKILQNIVSNWIEENSHLLEDIDCIIPIPLYPQRLRQRGFNQTTYLLSRQTVLHENDRWLKRIRHTPHQAGLIKEKRLSNLQGAFKVAPQVKDQRVLLFDDVLTTGSTVLEVSSLLSQMGVKEISVLVLSQAFL